MNDQYIDYVATFPKMECKLSDNPNRPENQKGSKESYWNELEQDKKMELNMQRSIQRTKTKVKRYVIHKNMRYMWTLTFAKKENPVKSSKGVNFLDAGNLKDAWQLWTNFIKRCKRAGLKFNYIVTIEVQEKRLEKYGEKVYHFHFATDANLPIDMAKAKKRGMKSCLLSLWNHGQINVQKQKSKKKFANVYLMKYITKMFGETKGSQRYRCSEGMQIPTETSFYESESAFDMAVQRLITERGLQVFKAYFPINDGHSECLYYGVSPKNY